MKDIDTSKPRVEPSNFKCEFGHALNKYFEANARYVHKLLCPTCDSEYLHAALYGDGKSLGEGAAMNPLEFRHQNAEHRRKQ